MDKVIVKLNENGVIQPWFENIFMECRLRYNNLIISRGLDLDAQIDFVVSKLNEEVFSKYDAHILKPSYNNIEEENMVFDRDERDYKVVKTKHTHRDALVLEFNSEEKAVEFFLLGEGALAG